MWNFWSEKHKEAHDFIWTPDEPMGDGQMLAVARAAWGKKAQRKQGQRKRKRMKKRWRD